MRPNIIGVINKLSYGIVTRNIIRSMFKLGMKPSLFPISTNFDFEPNELEDIQNSLILAQLFDPSEDCIRIWHQHDMAQMVGHGRKIGWPIFELNKFKEIELHHLNSCNELFVCSNWAKKLCDEQLHEDIKTTVVPLGVDGSVFNSKPNRSKNVFTIHNIGKIEIRKGHDIIPDILNKAFRKDDNFKLKMMWRNPVVEQVMGINKIEEFENYYLSEIGRDKVEFCSPMELNSQVAEFMNSSHVGLYPARAEGWNLSLLESMACGCHIVTTNYSAHTEYCNNNNSSLINISNLESAYDGTFFDGFGEWANISDKNINEFAESIRSLYESWKKEELNVNIDGIKTAKEFTWENTVRTMRTALNE